MQVIDGIFPLLKFPLRGVTFVARLASRRWRRPAGRHTSFALFTTRLTSP